MRRWKKNDTFYQIVIPSAYRAQIFKFAHDHVLPSHLGIRKTYERVLRYFFCAGVKSDVSTYCRSCHVCQLTGKPNQRIPHLLLYIQYLHWENHLSVLLWTVLAHFLSKKPGIRILTIMCAATRYPEAIPLLTIKAKKVVQELVKFCSVFGLPKVIQTDQGSNFMSKIFTQITRELHVKHLLFSAYHPQSQGAI